MHCSARRRFALEGLRMFLKRLFYASASLLLLVLAYHLGANTATAQGGGSIGSIALMQPGSTLEFNARALNRRSSPALQALSQDRRRPAQSLRCRAAPLAMQAMRR